MSVQIIVGDMREKLRDIPDASIDSAVTDPPYHLTSSNRSKPPVHVEGSPFSRHRMGVNGDTKASRGFMGQEWDGGDVAFDPATWAEVFRVLKPGAHLVAFSGTRTYHRMACAIEDAGFEIRDQLAWVYGSGFPKSHDVSKGIDKRKDWAALNNLAAAVKTARTTAGLSQTEAARRMGLIGETDTLGGGGFMWFETGRLPTRDEWPRLKAALGIGDQFDAAFEAAEREVIGEHAEGSAPGGLGGQRFAFNSRDITAPATAEAQQWQGWGTALKPSWEPIVLARKPLVGTVAANVLAHGTGALNIDGCRVECDADDPNRRDNSAVDRQAWREGGPSKGYGFRQTERSPTLQQGRWPANLMHDGSDEVLAGFPDVHGAGSARKAIREADAAGMWGLPGDGHRFGDSGSAARFFYCAKADASERHIGGKNPHPTVKPIDLMRWLVRLITPKGGTVLDPFMGSGSTLIAADREQCNAIGIELSEEYAAIAQARLSGDRGALLDAMETAA